MYNSADDYTQGYYQSKAMVDNNGHVFWPPPAKFRSSCKIDVTFFPFDGKIYFYPEGNPFLFFSYNEFVKKRSVVQVKIWFLDI